MCLHKHTTIVHQHLYNIKGIIYKSTGIVQGVGPAGTPHPPSSSLQFLHPLGKSHLGRGSVTRQGVSIFGPVIWEAAGLRGLQQDSSPRWNLGPRTQGLTVSRSYWQTSVTIV